MENEVSDHKRRSVSKEKKEKKAKEKKEKKAKEKKADKMKRKPEPISRWEEEGGAVLPTGELNQGQQPPVKQEENA